MRLLIKLILIGLVSVGLFLSLHRPAKVAVVPTVKPAVTYRDVAKDLGIDLTGISVSEDNVGCETFTANAVACFDPATGLHIGDVSKIDYYQRNAIVAHEYLHYIWYHTPQAEKNALATSIDAAYRTNATYLDKRLSGYTGSADRINELHSYECTEIKDLPSDLLAHCNKYIPNFKLLPRWN